MTEMFGEAWPPMSVPDLAPDDDDDVEVSKREILWAQLIMGAIFSFCPLFKLIGIGRRQF